MAFTITNTLNQYQYLEHDYSLTGEYWIGMNLYGQDSGAFGMVVGCDIDWAAYPTIFHVLLTSATKFIIGEYVSAGVTGEFRINSLGYPDLIIPTIVVQGSDETDSTINLSRAVGNVGKYGGLLITTLSAPITKNPYIRYDATISVSFVDGSDILEKDLLLIDSEILKVSSKPSANVALCNRFYLQDKTATTTHSSGTNVYRISIHFDGTGTWATRGDMIKIDSEYLWCIDRANNFYERGHFGSTVATHAAPADVYIPDQNLFSKIYAASVAGGWGYATTANNKMNFACQIIIGRTDQNKPTIAWSCLEVVQSKFNCVVIGKSALATRYTNFQVGIGDKTNDKRSARGSILLFGITGSGYMATNIGIIVTRFGSVDIYASIVWGHLSYSGGSFISSISESNVTSYATDNPSDKMLTYRDIICKGATNPSNAMITYDRYMTSDVQYGTYFLYGSSDSIVWNAAFTNVFCDAFAFVATGLKTFVNSNVNVFNMDGFWGACTYKDNKTIDFKCISEKGILIDGVSIKVYDVFGNKIIDALTDVNGVTPQYQITIGERDTIYGGGTTLSDITTLTTYIYISDTSLYLVNQMIRIKNELMLITRIDVDNSAIAVTRGMLGTIPESSSAGTATWCGGTWYNPFTFVIEKKGWKDTKFVETLLTEWNFIFTLRQAATEMEEE